MLGGLVVVVAIICFVMYSGGRIGVARPIKSCTGQVGSIRLRSVTPVAANYELDQADHLSCSLRQSSSLRRSAVSSAIAGVFALAIGLPSAVTNSSPSTSTGKSSGLRGLSFGMSPSHVKRKSREGITPSGFSSNCQSGRFRCWNDNIDLKERFHLAARGQWRVATKCGRFGARTNPSLGTSNSPTRVTQAHMLLDRRAGVTFVSCESI